MQTVSQITDIYNRIHAYRANYPKASTGTQMGWAWRSGRNDEWSGSAMTLSVESQDSVNCLKLVTTGAGYAQAAVASQSAATYKYLSVRSKALVDGTLLKIQWTTATDSVWNDAKSTTVSLKTTAATYPVDLSGIPAWAGAITAVRLSVTSAATVWVDFLLIDSAMRNAGLLTPNQSAITAAHLNNLRQDIETLKQASVSWENAAGEVSDNLRAVSGQTFYRDKHWDDLRARLTEVEAGCWNGCNTCNAHGCASCNGVSDSCTCNTTCYSQTCGCHSSCNGDSCNVCHSGHSCSCNTSCYGGDTCSYCHTTNDSGGLSWNCKSSCNSHTSCPSCHAATDPCYCNTGGCYSNTCTASHDGALGCTSTHTTACDSCHNLCNSNSACSTCHSSGHT